MQTGTLRIELRTGGALPVNDASVRVRAVSGELIYEEMIPLGDEGISEAFELEAPDIEATYQSGEIAAPYSLYNVEVLAGNYLRTYVNGVQIFSQREALLCIPMQPITSAFPTGGLPQAFVIPPSALRLPPRPEGDISTLLPQNPTSQLHSFPFIPEYITVHLGEPSDFSARNVTVTFQDYIKNVASSEIYPTWPSEALRANIIAQISFVLNRVYTEWYRSRGYTFDITNTTAFDQYFVEGRNIFKNISELVDEIFNIYMQKPGREEPLFARYCNGTTSKCDGLSQWGTVTLANNGMSAEEILSHYYGDIELVETDDLRGPFESYPGNPLKIGTSGESVRSIQERLNRIAINYPSIPFIAVNGSYEEPTERSVKQFQRIFNLADDGIVGKGTWYAISRIYVAVKNLAELTSEGERADYASQEYPGSPVGLGDRSVEVLEIQLYLSTISLYNNEVKSVGIDGVYGESTFNSVVSFQRAYGIDPDGVVGEITWRRLIDVYNGIINNVDVPSVGADMELQPYPGVPLTVGSEGNLVAYASRLLNAIGSVFSDIKPIEVSDVFSEELAERVKAFQALVALPETGILDENTWNYLNDLYRREGAAYISDLESSSYPDTLPRRESETAAAEIAVETEAVVPEEKPETACREIKRLGRSEPFERPLRVGSVGRDVEKMKIALCEKGYLNENAVNGDIFGIATRRAVELLQRDMSLAPTGRVDEATWKAVFN